MHWMHWICVRLKAEMYTQAPPRLNTGYPNSPLSHYPAPAYIYTYMWNLPTLEFSSFDSGSTKNIHSSTLDYTIYIYRYAMKRNLIEKQWIICKRDWFVRLQKWLLLISSGVLQFFFSFKTVILARIYDSAYRNRYFMNFKFYIRCIKKHELNFKYSVLFQFFISWKNYFFFSNEKILMNL